MKELLTNGGLVAVIGITTVFLVLIILWVILEIMHVIVAKAEKKAVPATSENVPANKQKKSAQNSIADNNPKKPVKLAPLPEGDPKQDKQFVAAVMGAIAGYTGADSFDFKIKSIKKL